MKRTIKLIAVGTNETAEGEFRERLYVVAGDDTIWRLDDPDAHTQGPRGSGKWKQLPALPDATDDTSESPQD